MPVERPRALGPIVVQGNAITSVDRKADASPEFGARLEAAGVDDAIDLVFDAVGHYRVLGDSLHALGGAGVDQGDVGSIECGKVAVAEGRSLAEQAIPGLQ